MTMRRVLVAVSGLLLTEFLQRTLGQLDWADAELVLLHVVDTRPLREFGLVARALPARAREAAARAREMGALGAEAGQRMLKDAETLAVAHLPPGTAIRRVQRTGVPDQEIIAAAHEVAASLIVLGAAEEPPPPEPQHPSPASKFPRRHLSSVVRFVVDHAPCDVLLLYAGPG